VTNYLVFYRPGKRAIFILKPTFEGSKPDFKAVYSQADSSSSIGIGQYDLAVSADRIFAFDYRGNGIADHLVLYRPGAGVLHIVRNNGGTFSRIYAK
jgi:hypothetical protein